MSFKFKLNLRKHYGEIIIKEKDVSFIVKFPNKLNYEQLVRSKFAELA